MKFETTPSFDADVRGLAPAHRALFLEAVRERFIPAAELVGQRPGRRWPKALRVKPLRHAPGIWETTWAFSGPDGRATFEWVVLDGQPAIRWRRVGSHAIFEAP